MSDCNLLVEAQPAVPPDKIQTVAPDKNLTRGDSDVSVKRVKVFPFGRPPTGGPKEGGSGTRRRDSPAPIPPCAPGTKVQEGMVVYSSVWCKVL